ncbi:MAG: CotH kinase family protein [Ruminococcus sp.]|nr:CotH kinase family protein [Ruminococcus sp.]
MKLRKFFAAVGAVLVGSIMSAVIASAAESVTLLPKEDSPKLDFTTVSQQHADQEETLSALYNSISSKKDMPAINITTRDKKSILSKEVYVESVIDVFNCDEKYQLSAVGGVKVRGNSTANDTEKPYRIKFDKKQNMLGLHDGKKYKSWVLLRSFWNVCPDYTAFRLAKVLFEGKYYSSDCTYVNLYINGKSVGVYLLCEQNQAGSGRADVYEPAEDEYQTDIGYFLEIDNYAGDDPYFTLNYFNYTLTDLKGVKRTIPADDFSVKSDINTQEQLDFIHKYMDGAFKILHQSVNKNAAYMFDKNYNVVSAKGVYTPRQAVEAVFDCESVANMLLLEELTHDYDVGAGSFYMAVDFSEGSIYPKLTFCAPWDFNWAYDGSTSGYYAGTWQALQWDNWDRSNIWLIEFMNADWFRHLVAEKWQRISSSGAIDDTLNSVEATVESLRSDIGTETWRIDSGKNVVKYVRGRKKWLDSESKEWLRHTITARDITLSGTSFTYTGAKIKPSFTVTYDGTEYKKVTDYTYSYKNNLNAGTATLTVTGKGACKGTATKTFTITKAKISALSISIPYSSYTYRGRGIKPTVTATLSGNKLVKGTDYSVEYLSNTEVGTAKIKISGMNSVTGSITKSFTIKPLGLNTSYASVTIPYKSYAYTGSAIKPPVSVCFKDGSVIPTDQYTVSYSNNTKVGIATITVKGKTANVTDTYKLTFIVKPANNQIKTITTTKGAFKITWNKATAGSVGYQVLYSQDKAALTDAVGEVQSTNAKKYVHSYTSTDLSDLSENFSKVPNSGETWYVKVRSFYTKDGKASSTRYGNYSDIKSINVK